MTTTVCTAEQRPVQWLVRVLSYVELTKPRISVMVLMTVTVAGFVATRGQADLVALLHTIFGTALVASSASALNQWLERDRDAMMQRTALRPLPSGRLSGTEVTVLGGVLILVGLLYLGLAVNWGTALLGACTWLLYICVYTPLKSRTALNTLVGAVAGAAPVLIGWSGVGGEFGPCAASVFLIVFLWQFPHFMAIAWIYRQQYHRAGLKMMTVVDPTGRWAGVQAVWGAAVLLPVSLVPGLITSAAPMYLAGVLALGVVQLIFATQFLLRPAEVTARRLLRASLIYLPSLLASLTLLPYWADRAA